MVRTSRPLFVAGVAAAPLFAALWAVQAFTRDGFRPTFHPVSLLSLGDGGWVQILNFVVTGVLIIAGGIGLRRTLADGRLARWATGLILLMGVGLVVAGVFVTDAGAGFPAGAPAGAPQMSWHGVVHEVGFVLTQLAFIAAGIVLAIRFARRRQRGWMTVSIVAVLAALLVPALGDPEMLAIRLLISAVIELGLVSALALGALVQRVR